MYYPCDSIQISIYIYRINFNKFCLRDNAIDDIRYTINSHSMLYAPIDTWHPIDVPCSPPRPIRTQLEQIPSQICIQQAAAAEVIYQVFECLASYTADCSALLVIFATCHTPSMAAPYQALCVCVCVKQTQCCSNTRKFAKMWSEERENYCWVAPAKERKRGV